MPKAQKKKVNKNNKKNKIWIYSIIGILIIIAIIIALKSTNTNSPIVTPIDEKTCTDSINSKIDIWKETASTNAYAKIIETKNFDNGNDALAYIGEKNFAVFKHQYTDLIKDQTDITIAIMEIGNNQISVKYPFVCFNGELTTFSVQLLNGARA